MFQSRSRSYVSLSRSYVTTVNNSFQPLPIFCHKELHLRCCIGLELNIVTRSTKILKSVGDLFPFRHPWSTATLGKFEKLTLLDALKLHFQTFFALSFLHLTSMDLNGVNINALRKFWLCHRLFCRNVVKDIQPFDFIKCNAIQQLAYKTKYIRQINGGLIISFEIW